MLFTLKSAKVRSGSYVVALTTRRFQNVVPHRCRKYTSAPQEQAKPFESVPGLTGLPLIGSLHHFLPVIGTVGSPNNFFAMTDVLYKKFGPIVKLDGLFSRATMLFLYEPEHFDQVYRSEDVTPLRPGFESMEHYRKEKKERLGRFQGLTNSQGTEWRDFRTKVNPALLKPKLVKLYAPALDEIAKEMVTRLIKLKEDPKYMQMNFDLEMTKWSLESVGLVGLGARLGCLKDDLAKDHPARQLLQCTKDIVTLSFKLELFPKSLRFLQASNFKKVYGAYNLQWDISEMYINEARTKINERGHEVPEEDKSIIEKLLAIDEKVAVMMANEMLLAGIDTVAFTTIGLLYQLAKNPKVQDKLRDEIRSGEKNKRYLKACLKESLRLQPVIAANLRRTSKTHIVGGYHIPEGVDVVAPNEYLSRMDKYYPQAKEFLPERWLVDKTDPMYYGNAHPMVTLPFGFGIRSCIGRRIAELEIEIFVQRLVNELQIEWDGPPLQAVTQIMNSFKKPYYFKFQAAK